MLRILHRIVIDGCLLTMTVSENKLTPHILEVQASFDDRYQEV